MQRRSKSSIQNILTFVGLFLIFTTLLAKASVIVGLIAAARIMQMI